MQSGRMPVPAPVAAVPRPGERFVLRDGVGVEGSPSLAAALAARTDLTVGDGADVRVIVDPSSGIAAEGYRLDIRPSSVAITAADAAGAFYAAETLVQLLDERDGSWGAAAVTIHDAPRFAYRGAMLDVARHFFPVEVVTGYVDRIAALKLNHLHLHLSDDQGWRLALTSRPELAARASATAVGGDPGGYWTIDEWRGLVAYAASRHVTVVPEVDTPGHVHAVGLAYPEAVERTVITPPIQAIIDESGGPAPVDGEPYAGVAVGFSSLRIGDPATSAFLADVFGELARETPGPYLHVGGDESLTTPPDRYARFVTQVTALVRSLGKTPIAWHEAGVAAAPGTIGQFWGLHADGLDDTARAFDRLILSPADVAYLVMKRRPDDPLGFVWADGPTSVAAAYGWDPDDVAPGATVLGVEAPLWTETLRTAADLDAMAFPRIAAIAEIAWSPRAARSWDSFRERVGALGPLWASRGIGFDRSPEIEWEGFAG